MAGSLVKVVRPSTDGVTTLAYLVSEEDAVRAINIIRSKIARSTDEVLAVGMVSEELLAALGIAAGDFRRADSRLL